MDQITIKTPNRKCRLYWCRVYWLEIQSVMLVFSTPLLWPIVPLTFSQVHVPPPPSFSVWLSTYRYRLVLRREHFIYSNFVWGGRGGVDVSGPWRLVCFGAALTWLWLGLKSAEELSHSPQWGSTVRTLVNSPVGRFQWTNHSYSQITQPGSSIVTPLYQ